LGNPPLPQDAGKSGVVDLVEPCLDVQKQGRHLEAGSLKGFHIVEVGYDRIVSAQTRQGAALVGIQHALRSGCQEEGGRYYPFKDLRDRVD